jgi:hypothetical protein
VIRQTAHKKESDQIINVADQDNIGAMDEVQQAAAAAAVTAARKTRRLKMISVLTRLEEFPLQTRNEIDEMDYLIQEFLEKVENNIHDMLCDQYGEGDNYRGLDSDRDTEAEVETVIRFFPGVLSRRSYYGLCPIQQPITCTRYDDYDTEFNYIFNVQAASFIHLFARLAIELGTFDAQYRGGLLCEDQVGDNVFGELMRRNTIESQNWERVQVGGNFFGELMRRNTIESQNRERRELINKKCVQVLIQLRKFGLFKKEDIQRYGLLHMGCFCHNSDYIPENSFRFLAEWDPDSLLGSGHIEGKWKGRLPLHVAVERCCILGFQLVFEYGIRYFPKKTGFSLLFKKDDNGDTSFQMACRKFGGGVVIAGVEETLTRYNSCSDNTSPLNIMEALVMAAVDENVHLDCLYFLLKREPDVLVKLLSPKPAVAILDTHNDGNENNNDENDGNFTKTAKRKRIEKMNEDGVGDDNE